MMEDIFVMRKDKKEADGIWDFFYTMSEEKEAYDDLKGLMENYNYGEGEPEEEKDYKSDALVFISAVLLTWFVLSFIGTVTLYKGLFRYIYAMKAVILIIVSGLSIEQHVYGNQMSVEIETNFDMGHTTEQSDIAITVTWHIVNILLRSNLLLTNELLTLLLLRELYFCTSFMEVRKPNIGLIVIVSIASFFITFFILSANVALYFFFGFWYNTKWWITVSIDPNVSVSLFSTAITALSLHYVIHILLSLRKSRRFQTANGSQTKNNFVFRFVLGALLGQMIWFAIRILYWSLTTIAHNHFDSCRLAAKDLITQDKCLSSLDSKDTVAKFLFFPYICIVEFPLLLPHFAGNKLGGLYAKFVLKITTYIVLFF